MDGTLLYYVRKKVNFQIKTNKMREMKNIKRGKKKTIENTKHSGIEE
jgi:hypothetical protein